MFFPLLKKGQIHLIESTLVLFVFFFLLMIGLIIYSNVQSDRLKDVEKTFNEQRAVEIAQKIVFLPELQCSNDNVRNSECFEIQKLEHFRTTVNQNALFYREQFPLTKVNVQWVYAPSLGAVSHPQFFDDGFGGIQQEQNLFNFSSGRTNKQTFYFPTSLWDKRFVPEKSYFGWLIIEVYS